MSITTVLYVTLEDYVKYIFEVHKGILDMAITIPGGASAKGRATAVVSLAVVKGIETNDGTGAVEKLLLAVVLL